jgi:hypothetical protein
MFWIALLAVALAAVLFRLGALTVWVGLLSTAWQVAAVAALLALAFVGWRFLARGGQR